MSYARTIVAMSRGALAPGGVEAAYEDHIEEEVPVVSAAPTPQATAATAIVIPTSRPEPHRDEPARASAPSQVIEHRETVYERVREVPRPVMAESPAPLVVTHAVEPERIVTVTPPAWLPEDPTARDPLVASADTDALRDLLRSVRQWTSSEPTIVAPETVTERDVQATVAAAEPIQVSIGNVVITVEDAPAPVSRGAAREAPTRASGDRLARNHIRGA
jgi:hypothetical protein